MLQRIALATVAAIVVYLIAILVGGLLLATNVQIAVAIGAFLKTYALLFAILAWIVYFFRGTVAL
jgi:hypothetical protein